MLLACVPEVDANMRVGGDEGVMLGKGRAIENATSCFSGFDCVPAIRLKALRYSSTASALVPTVGNDYALTRTNDGM